MFSVEVEGFFPTILIQKTNLGNGLEKLPSCEMKIPLQADKNSVTGGQKVIYLL